MKKKAEIKLWPIYFDSTKTRSEGRRVSKEFAIDKPRLDEIKRAVENIKIRPKVVVDAAFPKIPWQKTGSLSVPKKGPKNLILKKTAKELFQIRAKTDS